MGNRFTGTGNLGDNPTLKELIVGGEPRKVCELRVFFDNYRLNEKDEYEQAGGFWLDVNTWREGLAENCVAHLRKGARVTVSGRLDMQNWTDKESGEPRSAFRLIAEEITLGLGRIEAVRFRPKRASEPEDAAELAAA
jgi:single-strand DNA-binding protein